MRSRGEHPPGWLLPLPRIPSVNAGAGPIVCSPGGFLVLGDTASGGAVPRGAASPLGGPCLPLPPRVPPACAKGARTRRGCSPGGAFAC